MMTTLPAMTPATSTATSAAPLSLTCAPTTADCAERAMLKMRFIGLVEQFEQLTAADTARWKELDEYWHLELEHLIGHPVAFETARAWRDNLHFLLRQARERMQKNHPQFFHPFPPTDAALLRAHYASRCPNYPTTTRLTTLQGYPLTNGITRMAVGDYGAYIEFAPEQLVAKLATKFPDPQKPWIKYVWFVHPKDERTKIYLQKRTVQYADYRPGMYYVSPDDVWAYG